MRAAILRRSVTGASIAVTLWFLSATAVIAEVRPCTCRYAGESYAEGRCVCITTSGGPQIACCGKVLNNTSWSFGGGACPVARDRAPDTDPTKQVADFVFDNPEKDGPAYSLPSSRAQR